MKWILIKDKANDGITNMSIDKSLLSYVQKTKTPVIRFYKWNPGTVSVGLYESLKDVNENFCRENNIAIVRRPTGGKAVYHDRSDFTYSVAAPLSIFDNDLKKSYMEICSWIISALKELGINACLANTNDIIVNGKKISGNSANVKKGILLQHGTLIYSLDKKRMAEIFNVGEDLIDKKVTSVLGNKKVSWNEVYDSLLRNFTKGKEIHETYLNLEKVEIRNSKNLSARGNCYTHW